MVMRVLSGYVLEFHSSASSRGRKVLCFESVCIEVIQEEWHPSKWMHIRVPAAAFFVSPSGSGGGCCW